MKIDDCKLEKVLAGVRRIRKKKKNREENKGKV